MSLNVLGSHRNAHKVETYYLVLHSFYKVGFQGNFLAFILSGKKANISYV